MDTKKYEHKFAVSIANEPAIWVLLLWHQTLPSLSEHNQIHVLSSYKLLDEFY